MSGAPYASLILICGLALSLLPSEGLLGRACSLVMRLGPQDLYFLFMPLLVFESGYNSDLFMFKKCLKPILLLAGPGVLFSTLGFAGLLYLLNFHSISFAGLCVIGSILGSTDPIAVSALLKMLNAPKKLRMIIEGESLINDGTSIVCFRVFLAAFSGQHLSGPTMVFQLISLCVGGPLFGLLFGILFYYLMDSVVKDGVLLVSLTMINCFLIFFICEGLHLNMSGILAIVVSSVIISYKGKIKLHQNDLYSVVEVVWHFLQYVAETVLFLITGIFIAQEFRQLLLLHYHSITPLLKDTLGIVLFAFCMNLVRAFICLVTLPWMNDEDNLVEYKVSWKDCLVIAFAGIRGAFPLIICLGVARNPAFPTYFRLMTILITITVICTGLLFNPMSVRFLLSRFQISSGSPISEKVDQLIKKEILVKSHEHFLLLKKSRDFQMTNWGLVADLTLYEKSLAKCFATNPQKEDSLFLSINSALDEVFTELRTRMLFMLKNKIFSSLQDSSCSSESATILLEVRFLYICVYQTCMNQLK